MKKTMSNGGKYREVLGDSLTAITEDKTCLFAYGKEMPKWFRGLLSSFGREE